VSDEQISVFVELEAAIDLVKENFLSIKKNVGVDEVIMARKGLAAMLELLQDPFTNYIPPPQLEQYKSRKVESVVGIGLQCEQDSTGKLRIVSALKDGPADLPGIQTGFEISEIDGRQTRDENMQRINADLNGAEGTFASLNVIGSNGDSETIEIERRPVDVDYLDFQLLTDNILFVRIAWFSGTCYQTFLEKLEQYIENGIKGLILDLRSNSGGSIISTRNIFSSLCDQEVMYYGMKIGEKNTKDRVLGEHRFSLPLVVIINAATFSAGEVLAGALKDHGRAVIVGTRSGGKGSMQQVFPLGGQIGGALRITTATNCTPQGHIVQDHGITPDHEVEQICSELFVHDGPQNISAEGRAFRSKVRLEKLQVKYGIDRVQSVWNAGDLQMNRALVELQALIAKEVDANQS